MTKTANVKYVYIDVVGFTRDRSAEAQSDIIRSLNRSVIEAVKNTYMGIGLSKVFKFLEKLALSYTPNDEVILFLPSGDGMCIAFINFISQYDIHLRLALNILREIDTLNQAESGTSRKFTVRIGINEGDDLLVRDINRKSNIAGDGINTAQRIMSLAEGGQILVGDIVYRKLHNRERYMGSFSEPYEVKTKHNRSLLVYQFINDSYIGINNSTPSFAAGLQLSMPSDTVRLIIYSAYYGAEGTTIDVTELLRSRIVDNKLEILVENEELGEDPIYGVGKELVVEYSYQGKKEKVVVSEHSTLSLP
ncbi:MAG: hypothetical protein JXJ17_08840 [Anaerolineae bacterium]|nr:hypothetical protein [Anaerolineae bacterium]